MVPGKLFAWQIRDKGLKPDIFFVPVSGCGFGDLEAVKKGVFYTIKKLSPNVMVSMHAANVRFSNMIYHEPGPVPGIQAPVPDLCLRKPGGRRMAHGALCTSPVKTFD